jgi:AcrR family transcriptional regulator
MPRALDARAHRERREAFLDAAERLIQTRGYEAMSIQDVLDELSTSKGALYHYFDSKQSLLDGVVERFADRGLLTVAPMLADPDVPSLRKLERLVQGIAGFKAEQRALVLAIIEVWSSDGNALVREKVRRLSARRLGPILASIVRQGVEEGAVTSPCPGDTAAVLVSLVQGLQELAVQQFLAREAGSIGFDEVKRTHAAFTDAFERVLGVPRGSLTLADEATLRFWFG